MSTQNHGSCNQRRCTERAQRQQTPGLDSPQKGCAKKASDHGTAPVERNKTCGSLGGEARNLGQAEIIHQKASDRTLRAHIRKNSNCAQEEVAMLPNRILDLLSGVRRSLNFGKLEGTD